VIGTLVDTHLSDHSFPFAYKLVGGLVSIGLILFVARQMKKMVVRSPIRRDDSSLM
jgi:hypothetical protein